MVIGSSDGGPDSEEPPAGLADEIVSALPASTEYLIWVDSPEGRKAEKAAKLEIGVLGSLLGGGFKVSAFEGAARERCTAFSCPWFRHRYMFHVAFGQRARRHIG